MPYEPNIISSSGSSTVRHRLVELLTLKIQKGASRLQIRRGRRADVGESSVFRATDDAQASERGVISQLPPELLTQILRHVLEGDLSRSTLTFSSAHVQPAIDQEKMSILQGEANLSVALLVSHLWFDCGINILYERPTLKTTASLRLFASTVDTNKELAHLVRSVTILDCLVPWTYRRRSLLHGQRRQKSCRSEELDRCGQAFQSLLACPFIESLYLDDVGSADLIPVISNLLPHLAGGLRQLSLRRTHNILSLMPADQEYKDLEELSLDNVMLDNIERWPGLPSLRRLRIAGRCYGFHRSLLTDVVDSHMGLIPSDLPKLRTLELSDIGYMNETEPIYLAHLIQTYSDQLESLRIVGSRLGRTYQALDIPRFTALRSLVFKPNHNDEVVLPNLFPFPPNLIDLAILGSRGSYSFMETCLVDDLLLYLRCPAYSFRSLRHLYIEGTSQIWEPFAETLQAAARDRGILLKLNLHVGSIRISGWFGLCHSP